MESATVDKTQPIESEETRLLQEYEELTKKFHKQQLILSVMKQIDCNDIKDVDEAGKKNIDMALNFVRAYDYLKMDNTGTNVLGKFFKHYYPSIDFHVEIVEWPNVHYALFFDRSSRQTTGAILC